MKTLWANKWAKAIALISVLLSLASCSSSGSGLTDSTSDSGVSVTVNPTSLTSTIPIGTQTLTASFNCSSNDIELTGCTVSTVHVSVGSTYAGDAAMNLQFGVSNTQTANITVLTDAILQLPPYSYLMAVNPSTSLTGWTTYSEVVGTMTSIPIATGTQTCTQTSSSSTSTTQTCTTQTQFSADIPDYTPGTLLVTDGTQILQETTFGVLTGAGSGIVTKTATGYSVDVVFDNGPTVGVPITASYVTPLASLSNDASGGDLQLNYGSLTLKQSDNLLLDSTGLAYAQLNGQTLTVLKPFGCNNAAVTAVYSGYPYNASGGETVGTGDGFTTVFNLATKYAPIDQGSLKVFTAGQPATIQSVSPQTGTVTVSFQSPPARGEAIKASYTITQVTDTITLDFLTNFGTTTVSVPLTVSNQ
jgi:hypothetical protein